jgi:hypothetical protein
MEMFYLYHYYCSHGVQRFAADSSDANEQAVALWIKQQNQHHCKLLAGEVRNEEETAIREQIHVLESINKFPFHKSHAKRRDAHISALIAFKQQNGYCRVPQKSEDGLGRYVNRICTEYKLFKKNLPCAHLTDELVEELNNIGFEWTVKKSHEDAWNEKFSLLQELKNLMGTAMFLVTQRSLVNELVLKELLTRIKNSARKK